MGGLGQSTKKLNLQVKDLRNRKNDLTTNIVTEFSDRQITSPIIKISDGNLKLIETQHANVISFKFLLDTFEEFFNDKKQAIKLLDFIKSKRTFTNVSSIKRIYNKE